MLAGFPPFYDDNPFGIYEKILSGRIEWPKHMDPIVKDLVKKLLVTDRTKRLGNMRQGAEDIKRHRWFKLIDWTQVQCFFVVYYCRFKKSNLRRLKKPKFVSAPNSFIPNEFGQSELIRIHLNLQSVQSDLLRSIRMKPNFF